MDIKKFEIADVTLIVPRKYCDDRGYFSETYNRKVFEAVCGTASFVQDNQAFSKDKGTIRGLHFQAPPMAQAKLIRVVKGAVLDVAVDLRRNSTTFGRHIAVELSASNWAQLLVPTGFAHGYCTLEPDTEVLYKVDQYYSSENDKGLAWDDPDLAINWPHREQAILSAKDREQPAFKDLPPYFT